MNFDYWEEQFDDFDEEEFLLDDYGYHEFDEYSYEDFDWDELDEDEEDFEEPGGSLVPNKPKSGPTLDAEVEIEKELVLV